MRGLWVGEGGSILVVLSCSDHPEQKAHFKHREKTKSTFTQQKENDQNGGDMEKGICLLCVKWTDVSAWDNT